MTNVYEFSIHNNCNIFRDKKIIPTIELNENQQVFWFDNNKGASVFRNNNGLYDIFGLKFNKISFDDLRIKQIDTDPEVLDVYTVCYMGRGSRSKYVYTNADKKTMEEIVEDWSCL